MKKIKYIIATVFVVAIGAGIFWACQKDTEQSDILQNEKLGGTKNHKSMGNHQQPTQTVNINEIINVENVDYFVEGTAEVGFYNQRIYECDVTFEILVVDPIIIEPPTYVPYTMQLKLILNSEYEDLLLVVPTGLLGYTVTVQGNPIDQNYLFITGTGNDISYQTINELWTSIATKCYLPKSINSEYVMSLIDSTGINLYELAQSQFLSDYLAELDAFGAYFWNGIQNNTISMVEFESLIQEIILLPEWEDDPDENDPIFREKYHNYCAAMEQMSHLFFGNNFNHTEFFDGVTYEIATDRVNAIGNSFEIFQQQLLNAYPQFANLPEHIQEKTIIVVLFMAMGPCEDERDSKMWAEFYRWVEVDKKCKNQSKFSKCRIRAADEHELNNAVINDEYQECIREQ